MIPGNSDLKDGILFCLPFMIVFALFLLFPMLFGLFIGFFDWDILSTRTWTGFGNYVKLFKDVTFYSSLGHTLVFVLVSTPLLLVTGFLMALLVTSRSPLKDAAENLFFLPYILSITVIGTLWAWLLQKNYGIVNQFIKLFGGEPIGWLTDTKYAMTSIIATTVWWTAGFNMILFSAGIKQISSEIYDAVKIDGANYVQTVWRITLPLVRPTTALCLILQIIASFNIFGQVYVMTGGGPHGSTRVLVQYIYETGFKYFKMGYSSAMAYVLFFIILIISLFQYKAISAGEE
ncbi:carbohydrate ABC transporter permease [Treponema sp. Marseille-Q4132]|uniref:carbohydrate ABC transporter permease n=1 Tax=Treponema sp. Marseille-Q4132 TaxID=2766701 RepID=UPI001653353A|nr:sugar ABC transporter permease [Treponema sp. Marseille-Q4132]QNL96948.1 sugar ABC transporter permease [Treponema sp. Marseille-Q4132]